MTTSPEFETRGNRETAWQELGAAAPDFLDDRLAPAVDREFLRRFVRDELPPAAVSVACRLILLFPCWHAAHQEVLRQENRTPAGS